MKGLMTLSDFCCSYSQPFGRNRRPNDVSPLTFARIHSRGLLWLSLLSLGIGFGVAEEKRALSPVKIGTFLGRVRK